MVGILRLHQRYDGLFLLYTQTYLKNKKNDKKIIIIKNVVYWIVYILKTIQLRYSYKKFKIKKKQKTFKIEKGKKKNTKHVCSN